MTEFEKRFNFIEIKRDLFVVLYKSIDIENIYFITIDQNFKKRFYAETETKAIEIYNDFIKSLH